MNSKHDLKPTPSNRERGASLVEYSLLVGLIALVAVGSVRVLGEGVYSSYEAAHQALEGGAGVSSEE